MDHLKEIAARIFETAAPGDKEVREYKRQAKALLDSFLSAVKAKGLNVADAKKWAQEYIDEQEESVEMFYEEPVLKRSVGPGGRVSYSGSPRVGRGSPGLSVADAIKSVKQALNVKDYVADQNLAREQENIENVKRKGETIAKDPSQKIALLKKIGLTGEEFHALCLMIKDQIK